MTIAPLAGRSILITRAANQLASLAAMVESYGGVPIRFPCLSVTVMTEEISRVVAAIGTYSDLLFTSCNGVQSVLETLEKHKLNPSSVLAGLRVAAVGEKTARCLSEAGIRVDLVPPVASQQGLMAAYRQQGLPRKLLFFRAEEGSDLLAEALMGHHVVVKTVPAYRTVCPTEVATDVMLRLKENRIDAVLLGSEKAARHYLQRIGDVQLAGRPVTVGISEKMANATARLGLNVQLLPKKASFEAMLDILSNHFAK
ncbi:MAG: uroporphyrinogen-III synthase [Mariprofundus sp.]|nr:uroporphyrinogen-III synthase [Mariprofundus sp.]